MARELWQYAEAVLVGQRQLDNESVGRWTELTIKPTSLEVPGSTVHTGACELELTQ